MVAIVFAFHPVQVFAADWAIIADEHFGLFATPINHNSPYFFNVNNMTPGDTERATAFIRNDCSFAFSLQVEVKNLLNIPAGQPDLAEQFVISAYLNNLLIPDFPTTSGIWIFPENFQPGQSRELTIVVELPEETGNDFQHRRARLQWVFTAEAESPGGNGGNGGNEDNGGNGNNGGNGVSPPPLPPDLPNPLIPDDSGGSAGSEDTVVLPDLQLPLGAWEDSEDESNDGDDDEILIFDQNVPLAQMPRTGEAPLWHTILPGVALIILGTAMLVKFLKEARTKSLPGISC